MSEVSQKVNPFAKRSPPQSPRDQTFALQLPPIHEHAKKKRRKKVIKQSEHDQLIQVCIENIPNDLLGLIEQTRRLEVEMI